MDGDPTLEDRSPDGDSHETIGPYRLLLKLGEGGMGEVWLAEQSEPVRRRVAIKVIKAGMDTKRVIARFEAERQALAILDHPAIAKVFDAGETPRGLPFFAMEYVRGEPITEYCDKVKLKNEDRLRLFLQVCEGVQHAHQKGIIHRDLKPGNVLVTIQDEKPVPKIIDFGVAKAVSQRLTEKTLFTEQGVMIGTPEYMSPEQAEMSGLDVDTRTDVYSLGVMLYELVSGALPFDPVSLRSAGFDEIRRQIREVEPPPPSLRVSRAGEASADSAEKRQTDPSRLASRLDGELDWIVMKAIEKDRTRRYGSPSELAADIERHLSDQPVLAGPPSAIYRTRKFIKRHRFGVAAASLGVLAVLAFGLVMAIQAKRIATERDRAEQVSEFLKDMFAAANPLESQGKTVTARDILDKGAARIEKELKGQPLVQSELMHTMGGAYRVMGLCGEATRLFRSAADIRLRELGPRNPLTLQSMTEVGASLLCDGKTAEAETQLRLALERSRTALGPDSELAIDAAYMLGGVLDEGGRVDEAEALYRDALERSQRTLGPESSTTLGILSNLAGVVAWRSPKDAIPLVRELLPRLKSSVGENHPLYLVATANLADDLERSGDHAGALAVAEDALPRAMSILGEASQVANNLEAILGQAYYGQQRWDEAERAALAWIDGLRRSHGPDEPVALNAAYFLSRVYSSQHRFPEAEAIRRDVLARQRRTLGENHPDVGVSLYNLACTTALAGKRAESLDWLRQSVAHGYNRADLILKDTDLTSLHGDPGFDAIVAEARRKAPTPAPGK